MCDSEGKREVNDWLNIKGELGQRREKKHAKTINFEFIIRKYGQNS